MIVYRGSIHRATAIHVLREMVEDNRGFYEQIRIEIDEHLPELDDPNFTVCHQLVVFGETSLPRVPVIDNG